jgi:predicted unusual protein kinase regulating ubiquinone biosynthesis (AarF/ABC1/UbiB family)
MLVRLGASTASTDTSSTDGTNSRLNQARLRLAEARGLIPIGATENMEDIKDIKLEDLLDLTPSTSKVREISWRVAEPEVKYDPKRAEEELFVQPVRWITRNAQIFIPLSLFIFRVISDILLKKEKLNRQERAEELLDIISAQSPAIIKAGQALASRPDLLPKEYLDALQKLQDRCPAYPTDQAILLLEEELGMRFEDAFEIESYEPVAAASIGQVYRGRLRSNGAEVAIKVQRPNCEAIIRTDLYILRWYSNFAQNLLKLVGRDINLVSVIDDFGELIYREMDYRAEAVNAQRFAELYASIPDVFVPKVYTGLSTSKVLTMEWVNGARLSDKRSIDRMGLDSEKFVDILVQCSLRQMLENGFFHADPHGGNLLAMEDGKLCFLDFGMVSYVEAQQRLSIIEAVVHLVNRDFRALSGLYVRMGFVPPDVAQEPLIGALERALPDVLNASVGELNIKNIINKLGDVMFKFPFSLPPYYISIIRCLGVLEGVAIQVDKDFRVIEDAYPYIASRLLTDPSDELQGALQQLLFREGQPRWDRLEELLEKAVLVNDYDISEAADRLIAYISSETESAANLRKIISEQVIDACDKITEESLVFARSSLQSPAAVVSELGNIISRSQRGGSDALLQNLITYMMNEVDPDSATSPTLATMARTLNLLTKSNAISSQKLFVLLRKVLEKPILSDLVSGIVATVTERSSARVIESVIAGR